MQISNSMTFHDFFHYPSHGLEITGIVGQDLKGQKKLKESMKLSLNFQRVVGGPYKKPFWREGDEYVWNCSFLGTNAIIFICIK